MKGRYAKRIGGNRQSVIKYKKIDFSPEKINSKIRKDNLQRPLVLYPLALGVLGGVASFVLGATGSILGIAVAGTAIGLLSWAYNATLGHRKHVNAYLEKMNTALAEQVKQSIYQLEDRLKDVNADKANEQLDRLQSKFQTFEELLRDKLDETELTYGRYMGMTEQVFLASLDNLKRIADINKGTSTIDVNHIRRRLRALNNKTEMSQSEQSEQLALQERKSLLDSQTDKIQTLLSQNEQAMTNIDKVMVSVAEMNTGSNDTQASMHIEDAMQELAVLAARAKDYNVK